MSSTTRTSSCVASMWRKTMPLYLARSRPRVATALPLRASAAASHDSVCITNGALPPAAAPTDVSGCHKPSRKAFGPSRSWTLRSLRPCAGSSRTSQVSAFVRASLRRRHVSSVDDKSSVGRLVRSAARRGRSPVCSGSGAAGACGAGLVSAAGFLACASLLAGACFRFNAFAGLLMCLTNVHDAPLVSSPQTTRARRHFTILRPSASKRS
mmetsp:Transcript_8349/g.23564  ORF Transcript_8349/g.23564 Transcript_8349/m.23564 type:complete len:211 (-) Transcript_8349:3298-3930(-)